MADQRNTLTIDITIYAVNTENELSADMNLSINGYIPAWIGNTLFIDAENGQGSVQVYANRLSMNADENNTLAYIGTLSGRFNLIGESERYPFDSYGMNLTFEFSAPLPYYLLNPYWADVHSESFRLISENFQKWTNVSLTVRMPHYEQKGLLSTRGDPAAKLDYVYGSSHEAFGFNIALVFQRQINNVLPLLLLIVSMTYMLGATMLTDARWNPQMKTAIYLSFFVMVTGLNFTLRYMIPFRYGLTVAEITFMILTVATAIFSIGLVVSNTLFMRFAEKTAKRANLVLDFSTICFATILLGVFSVPSTLLVVETVGLFFGFAIRAVFLERPKRSQPPSVVLTKQAW